MVVISTVALKKILLIVTEYFFYYFQVSLSNNYLSQSKVPVYKKCLVFKGFFFLQVFCVQFQMENIPMFMCLIINY